MQEFLARIQVPRIVIFGDWRGLHERHKGPRPRGKNRNRPLKWPQMLSKVNGYREIFVSKIYPKFKKTKYGKLLVGLIKALALQATTLLRGAWNNMILHRTCKYQMYCLHA